MYTKLFFDVLTVVFFTNQVTNVLTEVIPLCKPGHISLQKWNKRRDGLCQLSYKEYKQDIVGVTVTLSL